MLGVAARFLGWAQDIWAAQERLMRLYRRCAFRWAFMLGWLRKERRERRRRLRASTVPAARPRSLEGTAVGIGREPDFARVRQERHAVWRPIRARPARIRPRISRTAGTGVPVPRPGSPTPACTAPRMPLAQNAGQAHDEAAGRSSTQEATP